jgi:hypothetical protein
MQFFAAGWGKVRQRGEFLVTIEVADWQGRRYVGYFLVGMCKLVPDEVIRLSAKHLHRIPPLSLQFFAAGWGKVRQRGEFLSQSRLPISKDGGM